MDIDSNEQSIHRVNIKNIIRQTGCMRTTQNISNINRASSNSQDTVKMKKSTSSASNKTKNTLLSSLNPTVNSMIYSIKKSRIENSSKSNKKSSSQSSLTNKSFKILSEVTSSLNITNNKAIGVAKRNEKQNDRKTSAIPVKNIKQKIIGKNFSQVHNGNVNVKTNIKPSKVQPKGKQNETLGDQTVGSKVLNKPQIKKYYHKQGNRNVTPRQKSQQSRLNFSCVLYQKKNQKGLCLQMFQIGRKLGKGRFGDVFMAKEAKTGLLLAIKMIQKKQLKQSQMENQLVQEIKIQSFSNHPNILKMYGFFDDKSKIYLLLELATNGCLFKQIRSKTYFQESLASFYFRQVASGIRYLHSNYVIHRDIKPQNILNCFNVLKICDFGWAIYSPIYQRQTFCGTLDYVPPQIVTGQFYDQKADVWCLGVLCYELCTGKAPFESKSDENQTYDKILKVQIQFPIYLSPLIVDFIGKLLHRQPNKRMALEQVQVHQWMRKYQNQAGRMISKQVWDMWIRLSKNQGGEN